jgi:hypothetical protein
MLVNWKNQYCYDDNTALGYLLNQCNLYPTIMDVFAEIENTISNFTLNLNYLKYLK